MKTFITLTLLVIALIPQSFSLECWFCHDIPISTPDPKANIANCSTVMSAIKTDEKNAKTIYGRTCTGQDPVCFKSNGYRGCGDASFVAKGECRTIPGTNPTIKYCNCGGKDHCNKSHSQKAWVSLIIGSLILGGLVA